MLWMMQLKKKDRSKMKCYQFTVADNIKLICYMSLLYNHFSRKEKLFMDSNRLVSMMNEYNSSNNYKESMLHCDRMNLIHGFKRFLFNEKAYYLLNESQRATPEKRNFFNIWFVYFLCYLQKRNNLL